MKRSSPSRRRPAVNITLSRAARLHRLVALLAEKPLSRDAVLGQLGIGLRTFYRELDLLSRCGVKVRHKNKLYLLQATAMEAEGRLPFPDPQLSFAEMAEISRYPSEASQRLAQLLETVINHATPTRKRGSGRKTRQLTKGRT